MRCANRTFDACLPNGGNGPEAEVGPISAKVCKPQEPAVASSAAHMSKPSIYEMTVSHEEQLTRLGKKFKTKKKLCVRGRCSTGPSSIADRGGAFTPKIHG
jgi:hypothetical protein